MNAFEEPAYFEYVEDDDLFDPVLDYSIGDDFEIGEPNFILPNSAPAPSPGCIAIVTLFVGLCLALFLLRAAAQLPSLSAAADDVHAVQTVVSQQAEGLPAQVANNGECRVSSLFPEKVTRWCGLITFYAQKHGLPPDLVAALIWLESGGDENAYSRSGAVGLMQVMPRDGLAASFMCVNGPCFSDRPSSEELMNPEFNIAYGTRMLAGLLRRHGNLREALKSYGPMNSGYSYADKVLGLFERYRTQQ
ncbi:MAG: transglycosylase SLT domain-containing protein [Anaerolineales bacterium]|nr:transglycosylase SLT domain-containing protein [Anaerolineales bacterium]